MEFLEKYTVGLIVPTYNAGDLWLQWLQAVNDNSALLNKRIIIDSSSQDNTISLASKFDFEIVVIEQKDFNHGRTRQSAIELYPDLDIAIFLTQDAILADSYSIKNILAPFIDEKVGAVTGRQLPHQNANPIASHARYFNYPEVSKIKTKADIPTMGIKTAFCSNSFAAYRISALKACGGFPSNVIFGEDMYLAAKMILADYKVVYQADATVFHSHNYSILEEFRRYFDIGVFHSKEKWLLDCFGKVQGEGKRFVFSELKYLGFKYIFLWPEVIVRTLAKYVGYSLGKLEAKIPLKIKKTLSMNKTFW